MPRKGTRLSDEARAKQNEAIKAWHAEHTTALSIRVRKEKADAYRALAAKKGQSLTSLICECLDAML